MNQKRRDNKKIEENIRIDQFDNEKSDFFSQLIESH